MNIDDIETIPMKGGDYRDQYYIEGYKLKDGATIYSMKKKGVYYPSFKPENVPIFRVGLDMEPLKGESRMMPFEMGS